MNRLNNGKGPIAFAKVNAYGSVIEPLDEVKEMKHRPVWIAPLSFDERTARTARRRHNRRYQLIDSSLQVPRARRPANKTAKIGLRFYPTYGISTAAVATHSQSNSSAKPAILAAAGVSLALSQAGAFR